MLKVIVRTDNAGMAANVGGAVLTEYRTFEIDAAALEAFLRENVGSLCHRQVVGVEILNGASDV
jgi:hypothetical protein